MMRTRLSTILVVLVTSVTPVDAISASPGTFRVTQPSTGTNITLRLYGGEHYRWLAEGQGIDAYTVLRNDGGDFVYATLLEDGTLTPSTDLVGEVDLEETNYTKNLIMSDEVRDRNCKARKLLCGDLAYNEGFNETEGKRRRLQQQVVATEGNITNLVVLMRWSDHQNKTLPPVEHIDILMNTKGPHVLAPTGSVRDVFWVNSYGKLNLTSTVYSKWIDMDYTETFYADGESGTSPKIQDAIMYALEQLEKDTSFDFGAFDKNNDGYIDAITFLHSGYGAEFGGFDSDGTYYEDRIWSHKWDLKHAGEFTSARSGVKVFDYHISPALWGRSGSRIGRIGVIAHETAHFLLGLPDLYDTQRFGQGIGSWCLMANSWGFDKSQYYPPQLSAWSRIKLGWDNATLIEEDGIYRIFASEIKDITEPRIYKIQQGYPEGEYLLIENRQPLMYDTLIPKGGLAIWHVDTKQVRGQGRQGFPGQKDWPMNGNHYRIALLQADTMYQLEKGTTQGDGGDLFRSRGRDEINASLAVEYGPYPNTGETRLIGLSFVYLLIAWLLTLLLSCFTDAYQGGNVYRTGNRIYEISASDDKMSFRYQKLAGDPQSQVTSDSGAFITISTMNGIAFLSTCLLWV